MRLIDLDAALPEVTLGDAPSGGPYRTLVAVPRLDGRPLGVVVCVPDPSGRVAPDQLARALSDQLGPELRVAVDRRGGLLPDPLPLEGLPSAAGRAGDRADEPWVTVIVTTCRSPGALRRCLESILAADYEHYDVVVVENRPGSALTERLLEERFGDAPVQYVEEPRRGLAWARNAGLARATGRLVAVTDDDVVVDRGWLRAGAQAFVGSETVVCVSGLILPLRLDTPSQLLLEQFAGFGKGFEPRAFRLSQPRPGDELLPYASGQIGSGANAFLRADVAREMGGFDVTLGAGTPAAGGEDLDMYTRLLQAGHTIAYEPGAIVWHEHPSGRGRLRRQVFRYGVGLTAALTKQLVAGPERRRLLAAAPAGLRYALDPTSRKNRGRPEDYPASLKALEGLGMAMGPAAWARSRLVTAWSSRR